MSNHILNGLRVINPFGSLKNFDANNISVRVKVQDNAGGFFIAFVNLHILGKAKGKSKKAKVWNCPIFCCPLIIAPTPFILLPFYFLLFT